jgi:multisubunit Na+/H+ antiporter MnhB subunit
VGLLAATVVLHYICLTILLGLKRQEEATTLERVFNAILPVVSGLAGSATTYYFTREGKYP